jgi:hypothetical protein
MKVFPTLAVILMTSVVFGQNPTFRKPWVYTKSFHDGTFTFVSSDHKVYEARCDHVKYVHGGKYSGVPSRSGANVCNNTLASVNDCTPDRGFPQTDTISFDGSLGAILYRSDLSTEFMKLKEVRGATTDEFAQAAQVCAKVKWEQEPTQ